MGKRALFDEVRIFPAYISPFKVERGAAATIEERLDMVHLAFDSLENVVIDDFEARKQTISYTIDTLFYMKEAFPSGELFLLLSYETKKDFPRWRRAKEIEEMATLLYATPQKYATGEAGEVVIPWVEINSTKIRSDVAHYQEFLDRKVLDYIWEHQIYS